MLKRILDIVVSVCVLVVLFPVIVLVAIKVRYEFGSPIIFRQKRIGFENEEFELFKFRSMTNKVDSQGRQLPDVERLTRFGAMLRSMSLDELPTLVSVLRGDMSLVGPRPLLSEYLNLYNDEQIRRHNVKPGVTGWAQINGRNSLSWEEKFRLDVWYVDHRTFLLDLKILLLTVGKVINRQGIREEGGVTMSKFTGTTENKSVSNS